MRLILQLSIQIKKAPKNEALNIDPF